MAKVLLGLSGGVDSSTAAKLLIDAGHEVTALTLRLLDDQHADGQQAQAVAQYLNMPHIEVDLRNYFKKNVVQPFAQAFQQGLTPNPCFHCNRSIKFGFLWQEAQRLGFDALATGHYAQRIDHHGEPKLARGVDPQKDQSYFLAQIKKDVLPHLLFPLGAYHKEEVRSMAQAFGLPTAQKKDSQDICFVPDDDVQGFLDDFIGSQPQSTFIDAQSGQVLGQAKPIWHYTIGQRKGLGLALGYPAYVTAIDAVHKNIFVGENARLFQKTLTSAPFNWLYKEMKQGKAAAKIRSRGEPTPCSFMQKNQKLHVTFHTPMRAITPGQAVVLYDGPYVMGGGIILTAHN